MAKQNALSKKTSPKAESKALPKVPPKAEPKAAPKAAQVAETSAGKPAPQALDRVIHERMRLGIVSALAVNESMTFADLKRLMDTTDGNLSVHARKLEEAGYVVCTKSFDNRVPKTEYALTREGRAALERYLSHMEAIIRATRAK